MFLHPELDPDLLPPEVLGNQGFPGGGENGYGYEGGGGESMEMDM